MGMRDKFRRLLPYWLTGATRTLCESLASPGGVGSAVRRGSRRSPRDRAVRLPAGNANNVVLRPSGVWLSHRCAGGMPQRAP
jgi:hypothetical protein